MGGGWEEDALISQILWALLLWREEEERFPGLYRPVTSSGMPQAGGGSYITPMEGGGTLAL